MALKTNEKAAVEPHTPPADEGVVLELALYTNYTWGPVTYEKGRAYRFKREDAMFLLGELDHDRPIWRQYQAPKVKRSAQMPIVDSTEVTAVRTRQSLEEAALRSRGTNTGKRIEIGTEDEISDILNRPEGGDAGDVVV